MRMNWIQLLKTPYIYAHQKKQLFSSIKSRSIEYIFFQILLDTDEVSTVKISIVPYNKIFFPFRVTEV